MAESNDLTLALVSNLFEMLQQGLPEPDEPCDPLDGVSEPEDTDEDFKPMACVFPDDMLRLAGFRTEDGVFIPTAPRFNPREALDLWAAVPAFLLADDPDRPSPAPAPWSPRRTLFDAAGCPLRPCDTHSDRPASIYCDTCLQSVCAECTAGDHRNHDCLILADVLRRCDSESRRFLAQSRASAASLQRRVQEIQNIADRAARAGRVVIRDIKLAFELLKTSLAERESALIKQVEAIEEVRRTAFDARLDELQRLTTDLELADTSVVLNLCEPADAAQLRCRAESARITRQLERLEWMPSAQPDEALTFEVDETGLSSAIASFGSVSSCGFGPRCVAEGPATRRALANRDNTFVVRARDHLDQPVSVGGDAVEVVVRSASGRRCSAAVDDRGNGEYEVSYRPESDAKHQVWVAVQGALLREAPLEVTVGACRDYGRLGPARLVFGSPGGGPGELCRPWGVCCDARGRIVVADRSNDRVQVFDRQGAFVRAFGGTGHSPGQLYRPAGVAVDTREDGSCRIVVVDKDNHRLQVFTDEGELLFVIGERGHLPGQFHYPWDVAVNEQTHEICVTDSRNSRVQLFTDEGRFLAQFGSESQTASRRLLDSPRGVAFAPDGSAIVTDFNHHRLLVLDRHLRFSHLLSGKELLNRPQGVAVDPEGNILVANSKNDEVCVLRPDGSLRHAFGGRGSQPGQFLKPTGLAVSPEGHVVVVDFDNTRVQCF